MTIESNESELALEQGIDKDPGKVSRGPTESPNTPLGHKYRSVHPAVELGELRRGTGPSVEGLLRHLDLQRADLLLALLLLLVDELPNLSAGIEVSDSRSRLSADQL